MNEYPLVSVIIPCYNRQDYISQTVDSVLIQTWPNIELIVIDDGCTDNSRQILESFGNRIRVLEHSGCINKGQSAAINVGLNAAKGDYISILDSDDLFLPQKIEKQISYFLNHPDCGLVYSNGYRIDERGNITSEFYPPTHQEKSLPENVLLDCYFLLPNNALVRRDVYKTAGFFDESLRSAQDHDMAIRIAEVTNLAYLDNYLFCYRQHKNSISQTKAKLRWMNGFIILKKASVRYSYSRCIVRKRAAVLYFRLGQCAWEDREYLKAAWSFICAGVNDPLRSLSVLMRKETISSPH